MARNIEYIEMPNSSIVKKFNIYFMKKVGNLFGSITMFLYLQNVKRKQVQQFKK